ncbi:MAG: hypothetical protein GYB65_00975 [Chloroflexi bacterium]|nr:hypothetical protein [Chloroflexota bacterium]
MRIELCRATSEEKRRALPGDDLVPEVLWAGTHAITINAPPAQVWPWLAQMGGDRAGWYSYDRLDNGGVRSARTIRPELQHIAVGDVMPALPGATDAFIVMDVQPGEYLVLGVPLPADDGAGDANDAPVEHRASWAYVLAPAADGQTRLVVRARLGRFLLKLPRLGMVQMPGIVARLLADPVHFIMQQKQFTGIKQRVERRTGADAVANAQ